MSKSNFSEDLNRDAVRQITERGHPFAKVSQRLRVSEHSLYEWKKKLAACNPWISRLTTKTANTDSGNLSSV